MRTKLTDEQVEDVEKIAQAIDLPNFSKPGAGKTFTTIGAVERMGFNNGVVVGPPSSMMMWQETLERELDGCYAQWLQTKDTQIDPLADFYVLTYAVLEAHFSALMQGKYGFITADESHYLKTPKSKRTIAMYGPKTDGAGGLYETGEQFWNLTGTPIDRYADDLWAQLRPTQPEVLQKYGVLEREKFERTFCIMQYKLFGKMKQGKWRSIRNQNERVLNRMLYDEIGAIRRSVLNVPVKFREVTVSCPLTGDLRRYLAGKTLEEIEEAILKGGDEINEARQLVGLGKMKDSVDYIHGVAKRQPVLVGYWHTAVGKELTARLQAKKLVAHRIGGDVTQTRRELYRRAFNAGEVDVIVGQIASMSESMNLQEHGCYVIIAEDDWSAAKIEQFYKRVARKGQHNEVQVDFLRAHGIPVDDALRNVRENKREGANLILD